MNQKNKQRCPVDGFRDTSEYAQQDTGFTLVEVLVVVLIIGVLGAISAPGWLGFVNRQRVNKANDAVLAALQEAQRQAKKTKLSYSVSFTTTKTNVAQIAIYPNNSTPDNYWHNLGEDVGINPGEVVLGTNMTSQNTAGTSITFASQYDSTKPQTITFDYMGTLPNATFGTPPTGSSDPPGLRVVVAVPNSGNPSQASGVVRCVILPTIIGGMRTAKDSANCNLP